MGYPEDASSTIPSDNHSVPDDTGHKETVSITCQPRYLLTLPGILKLIEIVISLVIFCLSIASPYFHWVYGPAGWVEFVTMAAFVLTVILIVFHLMNVIKKLPGPWLLIELLYYIIMSIFWTIAFICAAVMHENVATIVVTAVFCGLILIVFIFDAVRLYFEWKNKPFVIPCIINRRSNNQTTSQDSQEQQQQPTPA